MLPMLATAAADARALPIGADWAYEVKWDGVRVLADVHMGRLRLYSRSGRDVTSGYPELAAIVEQHEDILLDGEVVALDGGRPSFHALTSRGRAGVAALPVTYMVFDVLRLYGVDLTSSPWDERRAVLSRIDERSPGWRLSPEYTDGPALVDATRDQRLEGVVAKRRSGPYRAGVRSADWVKYAHRHTQSAVVGGWRPQTGTRDVIGALLLGLPSERGLEFCGRVGSGISAADQRELRRLLAPGRDATPTQPFAEPVPRTDGIGAVWVRPELVVDVRHLGHTPGGRLRQPSLWAIREDLTPEDVHREP